MSNLGGFRDRSSGPVASVQVLPGDVKGMVEVVVGDHRYCYSGTDLAGWVLRIAVSLNLGDLDTILEEMRKI